MSSHILAVVETNDSSGNSKLGFFKDCHPHDGSEPRIFWIASLFLSHKCLTPLLWLLRLKKTFFNDFVAVNIGAREVEGFYPNHLLFLEGLGPTLTDRKNVLRFYVDIFLCFALRKLNIFFRLKTISSTQKKCQPFFLVTCIS